MLKLFKPKKRLIISDIKIPIPMLAGIENATNLTEEQIDHFLRGGKLNIPVEQQKQQQNILPVILNEKIKPDESSSNSDYSSDSENDEDMIVDFLQKLSAEAQQMDKRTLITQKDHPPEFTVPMIQNPKDAIITHTPRLSTHESVKIEQPSLQKMDYSLDVAPTHQKQEKKRAEQDKINILKYQLEQAQQQYANEYQAHLKFVKERESMDHHIRYQISLAKQKLHHVLYQRSMSQSNRLRTSRSYPNMIVEAPQVYWLEKDDNAQRKDTTCLYNDDARQRWLEDCYRYYNYYYRPYYYYNKDDAYWDDYRYEPRIRYYESKEGVDERRENAYYQYRAW